MKRLGEMLSVQAPWFWRAGQVVQGIVMGCLLLFAVIGLLALANHVAVFRYQGY